MIGRSAPHRRRNGEGADCASNCDGEVERVVAVGMVQVARVSGLCGVRYRQVCGRLSAEKSTPAKFPLSETRLASATGAQAHPNFLIGCEVV